MTINLFRRKQFKPQPKQLRIDGVKTVLTAEPDDAELAAQALLETLNNSQYPITNKRGKAGASDNGSRRKKGNNGNFSVGTTIPAQLLSAISFISAGHKKDSAGEKDAQYYRNLSEKIRAAHDQERRMAMRYVAYCEEELKKEDGRRIRNATLCTFRSEKMEEVSHQPSDIIACHTQTFRSENHQTSDITELERGLYKFQDCAEREGGELLKRWQKCLALVIMKQYKTETNTDLTDDADGHQPSDI